MVLEEASLDTLPEESNDSRQTSGQLAETRYHLDLEKLPRAHQFIPFNVSKYVTAKTGSDTYNYLAHTSAFLRRPLTQDEAQAAAYHLAKKNCTAMHGLQVGFYWGLWRAWSTRKNYAWPVIDPVKKYPDFNPRRFFGLEGQVAIVSRHFTRGLVWLMWGMLAGQFVAEGYASIRGVRDIAQDERLKAVMQQRSEELKRRAQGQMGEGSRYSSPMKPKIRVEGSDMSLTGESYPNPSTSTADFYGRQNQASAHQVDPWSTTRPAAETSDDDASPTGGLGTWDETSDPAHGGSAWDRLRQQSASKASSPKMTSSENDWISQEASSQQPELKLGAWDRIRQQQQQKQQQQKRQQKDNEEGWWK